MIRELKRSIKKALPHWIVARISANRWWKFLWKACERNGLHEVSRKLIANNGVVVRWGPFAGLKLPPRAVLASGNCAALVGTYEMEIHPWLERACARPIRADSRHWGRRGILRNRNGAAYPIPGGCIRHRVDRPPSLPCNSQGERGIPSGSCPFLLLAADAPLARRAALLHPQRLRRLRSVALLRGRHRRAFPFRSHHRAS